MKNRILNLSVILLLTTIIFTSCDKDDDDVECKTETPTTKSVIMEFEFEMDGVPFQYGEVYEVNGVNVEFSDIRFYISDIMLHDDAENSDMFDKTILVDVGASSNDFSVGSTGFHHIHELHMLLGLNDLVNHEDPTQAEAPLNDASMHWGWDPDNGYKFIRTEAMVDTDADGVPETAVSIHCATDDLSREIMLDAHQDVEGNNAHLELKANVASFYTGVDFLNLDGTHGNSPLTNSVADNVAGAIELE